ncbi:SCO family protein [Sphingosinicella sp. LHD-64]|uniref:SCO family protein n=1 Tax=Sphingosinicella sp. LHD-64 TaxID=3072139 RepID=UPI00280F1C30|nr:SCO family protein [Sphingosinicella sp. LHD-64]MDQ8757013.1 SCO family protein [Sphingosinicella sp. LHD-64]
MNENAFARLLAPFALGLALFLAACQQGAQSGPPPLEGATMGGPFTLTNQDGRRQSDTDFAGMYRLVYFGYTFCPDVCPVDMQVIGAGLRRFEEQDRARAERVQPIFITVDPVRDTPEVLRAFVRNFHPRLIGLTGSETEIANVARAYAIHYNREPPNAQGAYLVDHTRVVVLYGPNGEPVAIIPHDQGADGVAAELARWVR